MPLTRISPRLLKGIEVQVGSVNAASAAVGGSVESSALGTITIPANSLGANGYIRWECLASYPNNANTKTILVKVNGTTVSAPTATTTVSYRFFGRIVNRNNTSSQVSGAAGAGATGVNYGAGTGAIQTFSFDTTQNITVAISVNSSSATTDMVNIQYFNVFVCYIP